MKVDPWFFPRWSLQQRVGNPTRKIVLHALATMAESNTGYCFARQDDLAEFAEVSVRSVSDHLKALESMDLIRRKKRYSPRGYRIADAFLLLAPGVAMWPNGECADGLPADSSSGSPVQSLPEAQASEQERPVERPNSQNGRASNQQLGLDGKVAKTPKAKRSKQVGTKAERSLAGACLTHFNEKAGTSYTASSFIDTIVRRIEEHPALTLPEHMKIIDDNLAEQWWDGRAHPRLIYGNAEQFERAMHSEGKRRKRKDEPDYGPDMSGLNNALRYT